MVLTSCQSVNNTGLAPLMRHLQQVTTHSVKCLPSLSHNPTLPADAADSSSGFPIGPETRCCSCPRHETKAKAVKSRCSRRWRRCRRSWSILSSHSYTLPSSFSSTEESSVGSVGSVGNNNVLPLLCPSGRSHRWLSWGSRRRSGYFRRPVFAGVGSVGPLNEDAPLVVADSSTPYFDT
jgi:hypothetical protein